MNRALLVGINNYPTAPLRGCVNDITDMAGFLVKHCGFQKSEIRLLADERATKANILERLGWLLTGARPGNRIYFHFSGHGVLLPTRNPQGEVDGLDEVICPWEFNWTDETAIRDKEFASIFSTIPEGVLFTMVSDSCHSEDVHRLMLKADERIKTILPPADIAWRIEVAAEKRIRFSGLKAVSTESNVLLLAGCKSDQTSADDFINGRYNGALTRYLIDLLTDGGLNLAMKDVVQRLNTMMDADGYSQDPQLNGIDFLKQRPFLQ